MSYGEAIFQEFSLLKNNPEVPVSDIGLLLNEDKCCYESLVFASTTDDSDFKNDKKGFLFFFSDNYISATMKLQKFEGGVWVNKVDLVNDTYGEYNAFGFIVNRLNQPMMEYVVYWRNVLLNGSLGVGSYRVQVSQTDLFATVTTFETIPYCLAEFDPYLVEGTVRMDYYMKNFVGDVNKDQDVRDFGIEERFNQIRIDGKFGFNRSSTEVSETEYQTGWQEWIETNQVREYSLRTGMLPESVHNILELDVCLSDEVYATDYNHKNANKHIDRGIRFRDGYEPEWQEDFDKAQVTINFKPLYQNRRKERC